MMPVTPQDLDLANKLLEEFGLVVVNKTEAADRIEQLERELAEAKEGWHGEMPNLQSELAAEKALADRLIAAGANALQGDPRRDKGLVEAWDYACAAYRKARGL